MVKLYIKAFIISSDFMNDLKVYPGIISWPKRPSYDSFYNIKGNKNSKGEKIYHMPGQQFYDKTNAEEMFCSAAEAQAAGYRASKR
ncbi:hypothetical protein Bmyc01_56890 [Bacillus mycoides]|nr:hypothetical protein Bmyc01_56890 [Bacillus mycoides]